MLANGATLEYKKKSATESTYTKLKGLKEIPEMGVDPEKVENTDLDDTVKQYEMGTVMQVISPINLNMKIHQQTVHIV